ncbi:MAG TPA: adaptor protein MecA [Acetivibrio sp.]|jgi:adapter protein MecA 1/2|nr:adaptor protein MecA [Clostridium sp.]HOQ36315.1 adaptor protein MecA [Acetivibrio sp.]HPT91319.1 adaptor protein MecA [Acetivibrio sp.]HQA56843.1 adaptor protein MecA [Acetivibrio sp.]
MKIEKINDNMLKVTISIDDLEERNIDLDTWSYNSPATQKLFGDMMEQAELQFGFCVSGSEICIEAAPDSDEGFVIIITKLDDDDEFESIEKYIKNKFRKTDLKSKKKNSGICSTILIYCFKNFDDLCLLSQRLMPIYTGESTLYRLKEAYYLLLTKSTWSMDNYDSLELILNEFGDKITNVSFYEGYLNEHGEKIIEYDAVETLYDYFC